GKRFGIGTPEDRNKDGPVTAKGQRAPINVKKIRKGRSGSEFQHVEPPRIVGAVHRHMVRHEVEKKPHVSSVERLPQNSKTFLASQFRIERIVVDDVISMLAA